MSLLSFIDYLLTTGLYGLIGGLLLCFILYRIKDETRVKRWLQIIGGLYLIPLAVDLVLFGMESLLSIALYGLLGPLGLLLCIYAFIKKQWLPVVIFLVPIFYVIGQIIFLGP